MNSKSLWIFFAIVLFSLAMSGCATVECDSCCPECPTDGGDGGDPIPTPGPLIVIQPTTSEPNKLSYCEDGDEANCKVAGDPIFSTSGNTFKIPEQFSGTKISRFGCYEEKEGEEELTWHNAVELTATGNSGNDYDARVVKSSIGLHWFIRPSGETAWEYLVPTSGLDPSKVPAEFADLDPSTISATKSDESTVSCVTAEFKVHEP